MHTLCTVPTVDWVLPGCSKSSKGWNLAAFAEDLACRQVQKRVIMKANVFHSYSYCKSSYCESSSIV